MSEETNDGIEVLEDTLNQRQEMFCVLYATHKEFFGNGVWSYAEAYGHEITDKKSYKVAQACASRLLSNAIVLKRISELLETEVLNDAFVDKQLGFLITQQLDFKAKVAAIKEYNALKARIKQKMEVNFGDEDRSALRDLVELMKHGQTGNSQTDSQGVLQG
jgi:hypothetical protein